MEFVLILVGGAVFYALLVLVVALTGPHSEIERREYEAFKHEKRRKRLANQSPNTGDA